MSNYEVRALPLYTKEHTWVRIMPDGTAKVGITDYAQKMLNEVNFADLPSCGDDVTQMQLCAELESTKTVSPVYCPLSGTVIAVNNDILDEPGTINQAPYDAGWLFDLTPSDLEAEKANLLNSEGYKALLAQLAN